MKLLGRWSLASFMKVVIDVPYYLLLVLVPVVVVFVLWAALAPGRSEPLRLDLEIPVRFQLDPASHPFTAARQDVRAVSITKANGTLKVEGGGWSRGIVCAVVGLAAIALGVVLFVFNRLRAILRTLRDQNPFVALNASRIRMIGIVLILGPVASAGLDAWLAAEATRDISVAGLTFSADLSLNTWAVFSGLVLLMLAEVFRLGAEMKGDLETARKIQFALVPGEIFRQNDAEVHARMRPAKTVGGDYYDIVELDQRHLAIVVGDVTGKGMPAAMLMASVLGSVRALCSAGLRGAELIAALNRHVCTNAAGGRFVTLFYGELDTKTGELTYVNAGHNPPILLRADGRVDRLQPTCMVLGVMADTLVETRQAEIAPTDRLLLFTDGFSEAFNKKDEEYGEERLIESLVRVRTLPAPIVVERLTADVLSFCGSIPPHDDMTLMLVGRQPA
jgi:serine phosphatase RsbU (regulator of sigma subunit)